MDKKDVKKGMYVVFLNTNGTFVSNETLVHVIKNSRSVLCGPWFVLETDKFSKAQPKSCKGKKLILCLNCAEKAKKAKKAVAKKKK